METKYLVKEKKTVQHVEAYDVQGYDGWMVCMGNKYENFIRKSKREGEGERRLSITTTKKYSCDDNNIICNDIPIR